MSKQIPELTIITTPTAGQESLIETVVARHDTYATSRMTLAQIFTLGSISGAIKSALDTLSGLISGNTTSINTLSSTKLNIVGGTRTGLTANRAIITDGTGVETYLTGTTTQVIGFDGAGKPIAVAPSVDIHGQTLKTSPVGDDEYIIADSENSFSQRKIKRKALPFYYGDGSDGSVTVSTTISLTRDMQYSSLTITGAGTINTRGYKIFVSGTLTNSGIIQIAHGNGGSGSGSTGGIAAVSSDAGTLGNIKTGGNGGNGGTGLGTGTAGAGSGLTSITAPLGSQAANGGGGGAGNNVGTAVLGGIGATGTNQKYIGDISNSVSLALNSLLGTFQIPSVQYVSSGGAGGGGSGTTGGIAGGGGAAGNGGGMLFIAASSIVNNGNIQIIGGNAGNGANASSGTGRSDGGGGGGGGGNSGIVMLLTSSLTGSGNVKSIGGNGGNGGNASVGSAPGAGDGGNGGNGGNGGMIVSAAGNTFVVTGGTGGTAGTNVLGGYFGSSNGSNGIAGVVLNY